MQYFLLIYGQSDSTLIECHEYGPQERQVALAARFAKELEFKDRGDVEIVVLGADSRKVLEQTHARYFHSVSAMIANVAALDHPEQGSDVAG